MKKTMIIALLAMVALTASAKRYYATYQFTLVEVETPDSVKGSFSDLGSNTFGYEDELISIVWSLADYKHFAFDLTNKAQQSIKIRWDDISYVGVSRRAERVIHSGIALGDKNKEQAPTTVPRRAAVADVLVPADNFQYVQGLGAATYFFFNRYYKTLKELEQVAPQYVGSEMSLLFPVEIEGKTYEYMFIFKVSALTGHEQ